MPKEKVQTDVLIIGAGYAGIAAAKKLHDSGISFTVVEARDRIGGRTLTEQLPAGATVDLGAQWIGPDQHLVWEWVRATGTPTYGCYNSGRNILSYRGKQTKYKGTIPRIDPVSLLDLGLALRRVNKLSARVPLDAPWTYKDAVKLDGMTVQSWMDRRMFTGKAKFLFTVGIETVFAAHPSELSFLGVLHYAHSGKDMDALISVSGGAQQTLLVNGTQELLQQVAGPFAGSIETGEPVESVRQTNTGIIAETRSAIFESQYAIVTVPPALVNRIRFDPMLPQMKYQLYQRMPMGAAMKCFCIYDRPFWREQGFSGQIVGDRSPVKVTFDCSKSDSEHGILLVFVEAGNARKFIELPLAERRKSVTEGLVPFFGAAAAAPLDYIDKCWTQEEWSGGCYTGISPPGVITQFRNTIREPFGRIRFAGTETATEWTGYLDGAIQSGYREAEAILRQWDV